MAATKAAHCGLAKQSQPPTKADCSGLAKHISSTDTSRSSTQTNSFCFGVATLHCHGNVSLITFFNLQWYKLWTSVWQRSTQGSAQQRQDILDWQNRHRQQWRQHILDWRKTHLPVVQGSVSYSFLQVVYLHSFYLHFITKLVYM